MILRFIRVAVIITVIIVVVIGLLICAFFASVFIRFYVDYRNTPQPGYLTDDEIVILESAFGITFPASTTWIKVYYNGDGGLYCAGEFGEEHLASFKAAHNWNWISGKKGQLILGRNCVPPLRITKGPFGRKTKPLRWWNPSEGQGYAVSSIRTPYDPGGHIDTLVGVPEAGKVRVYIVLLALEEAIPRQVLRIFPSSVGWDVREGRPYPKQGDFRTPIADPPDAR